MTPLYPAIILTMYHVKGLARELSTGSDGHIRLERIAQLQTELQTVLMVRTGHEERLSAPISFESLRDRSVPVDRPDTIGLEDDIIRVTIPTAVKSITGLERHPQSQRQITVNS